MSLEYAALFSLAVLVNLNAVFLPYVSYFRNASKQLIVEAEVDNVMFFGLTTNGSETTLVF